MSYLDVIFYLALIALLFVLVGCNDPCVQSCFTENEFVVENGWMTSEELDINCEDYCNSPAAETGGYADGEARLEDECSPIKPKRLDFPDVVKINDNISLGFSVEQDGAKECSLFFGCRERTAVFGIVTIKDFFKETKHVIEDY